jgi:hypothetical protein
MAIVSQSLERLEQLDIARRQLSSINNAIENLRSTQFPYEGVEGAVKDVENALSKLFMDINNLVQDDGVQSDTSKVMEQSLLATTGAKITNLLPIMGFLLRSTNTRNAFELKEPLLQMARKCVDDDSIELIISSDWQYSASIHDLRNLRDVKISMPAHEATNSFIFSLAGHELGHAMWQRKRDDTDPTSTLDYFCQKIIEESISFMLSDNESEASKGFRDSLSKYDSSYDPEHGNDYSNDSLFLSALIGSMSDPIRHATNHAEEVFCDFVGLWLFGEAFLHAFAYDLALFRSEPSNSTHPSSMHRSKYLVEAYGKYFNDAPVTITEQFKSLFKQSSKPDNAVKFEIVNSLVESIVPRLIDKVEEIMDERQVIRPQEDSIAKCMEDLSLYIPNDQEGIGIGEILIAGWRVLLDQTLLNNDDMKDRREAFINELILKSLELLEIRQIIDDW